jgi:hypothetical protein
MKNDDNKNDMAPKSKIKRSSKGSSILNLIITILKLANDPGRVALLIGSKRLLCN